ncbi:TonB-dependent receptor [Alishewanella agri BL06]|uniref:TonB-dependent receptor n=1 Tax=Alishewanella agri BL06 TaxID=1195246 RepID=I8U8E7_9ALTE|nr:TonB-dependent receptor [Alishewanella agri]EIW89576.1 TonB-dependent receptor [Alishewanella agri BL06]
MKLQQQKYRLKLCQPAILPLAVLTALTASPILADETDAEKEKARVIEVIEVTATRQTENLQRVPIAVTALSGAELEQYQIQNLGQLEALVPNLNLHVGDAANAVVYIRGVGQLDSISFNDPGVGIYLDDVYLGRVQGAFLDVVDPQQIEVLRGPQGTLYGRNTIGGAVKFTSARPSETTEGYVSVLAGNYQQRGVKASLTGPLIDEQLAGRFAIAKSSRDGFSFNQYTGKNDYDKDSLTWRGSLLFTPVSEFTAYLVLDGSNQNPDYSRTPHRETPIYSLPSGDFLPVGEDPFVVNANFNDREELRTKGVALTLDYQLQQSTLKSITAYREMNYRTHLDLDGTPDASFGIYSYEDQDQLSQELQWLYRSESLSLVSGLFYFRENSWSLGGAIAPDFFVPLGNGVFFPFPVISAGLRDQTNTSYAVYSNMSWQLSEPLSITLGARWTSEKKQVSNSGEEFFGTGIDTPQGMQAVFGTGIGHSLTGYDASQRWNDFSPRAVLNYQYSSQTMLYSSVSKGFKSGGFNGRLTSFAQPYDPETLWSYEAGAKSLLLNQQLRLNTAFFYNDYKNFQLSRFSIDPDTGAFLSLFENSGKATTYGAELELQALLTDSLTLNMNLGYLNGGYDKLIGDFEQEVSDERELVNAPRWNGRLGLDYWFDLGSRGTLSVNAGASFKSKTYLTVSSSDLLAQPGFTLYDLYVNWQSQDERWQLNLFGKNLTDKRYRQHGFDLSASPGVQLGYYGDPRTYGLQLTYRYF